jgi:hypothetical protein
MAVVGDNRGVRDRPGVQRPDGSWSFEDARRRRDQRQGGGTSPSLGTGDPEEDLSALALSLADNLTVDGTPLSELETRQERGDSDALGLPAVSAPTADEIMHALETERHAAPPNGAENRRRAHLAPQPQTRRARHGRWPRGAPSWLIAGIVSAGVVTALVGQLVSGAGTTAPRRPGRALAAGAATASLSTATARFLAVEHAADRVLGPARSTSARETPLPRHRHTILHTSGRRASNSSSTTTSSTSGTSETVDTAKQSSPSSSSPSSGSASSGSGQGSTATQPHTSPSSSSSTPSKATLRSLVTGAGTCSCR